MSKINDFLTDAGVFFLATEDGPQPKLRPLGAHHDIDGKVVFGIGDFKDVYRQLLADPLTEIVAFKPQDRTWLRYTGRVVFDDNPSYVEVALEALPHLRQVYNEETGKKMMMFHLEDATAKIIDMAGNVEVIE